MEKPSAEAMEIVERFAWSSNVMRDGKLIGQQYIVAEAIDEALAARDKKVQQLEFYKDQLLTRVLKYTSDHQRNLCTCPDCCALAALEN